MTRSIASRMMLFLFLLIPVALLGVTSPKFAHASSIRRLPSSPRPLPPFPPPRSGDENDILASSLANTTNTTNATTPSPTPTQALSPTPKPTAEPTKKYEPIPDDNEEGDEEKNKKDGPKVGVIFLWIVVAFALIWIVCYFRDGIVFFFANAWNNTRRYGCKGCLQSFFPCILGSRSGAGGGSEPLDQIIFETEDPNLPLMS